MLFLNIKVKKYFRSYLGYLSSLRVSHLAEKLFLQSNFTVVSFPFPWGAPWDGWGLVTSLPWVDVELGTFPLVDVGGGGGGGLWLWIPFWEMCTLAVGVCTPSWL